MMDQSVKILMVDDSEDDVLLIARTLSKAGLNLLSEWASNSATMKKALRNNQWDIVICDYDMPDFDVSSAVSLLKESGQNIPLIVVSGNSQADVALACMSSGARDYVSKDDLTRLCPAIKRELATAKIISRCAWLDTELQQTIDNFKMVLNSILQIMVAAVEARDPYNIGHQFRSAELAYAIAEEIGLPHEKMDGIKMAGSIHDIGKISVPLEVLVKPANLTDLEFSLVKEHSGNGYEILKDIQSPWPLAQIVQQHHERMDGSGYPKNLKGDEILVEARILAISDVVESMVSKRPYRPALGIGEAMKEIEANKGRLYDDTAVDACLKLFREKGYQFH
ncbi:MAG: HD domain-containing phosphohydrolase [Smithella sp.]|nr:HD domain-containing phosphohydrolase [Smithella sp.]